MRLVSLAAFALATSSGSVGGPGGANGITPAPWPKNPNLTVCNRGPSAAGPTRAVDARDAVDRPQLRKGREQPAVGRFLGERVPIDVAAVGNGTNQIREPGRFFAHALVDCGAC